MPSLSPSSSFSLSNSQHCATVDSTISWSATTPSFSQIVYKAKVAYLRRTNKNYSSSTWNRQLGTGKKCVTWGLLFIVSAGARETTFCHSQMLPSLCVPRRDTDEDVSSSTSLLAAPRPYNVSLSFWAKSSQSVSRRVTEWVRYLLHMNLFQYHRFLATTTSCAAAAVGCVRLFKWRNRECGGMNKKLSDDGDEWIVVAMKIIFIIIEMYAPTWVVVVRWHYLQLLIYLYEYVAISRHPTLGQCQSVNLLRNKYSNKMFRYPKVELFYNYFCFNIEWAREREGERRMEFSFAQITPAGREVGSWLSLFQVHTM